MQALPAQAEEAASAERPSSALLDAGTSHNCAILETGQVRCWGSGFNGQLGYGNTASIGDGEAPDTAGPVDLGAGRSATSIAGGRSHTCAVLDTGDVRCWGSSSSGQLGYGNTNTIGDNETPASAGAVDIGAGRTAVAIAAATGSIGPSSGGNHTCAILDTGDVRCWGAGSEGQLGYGNTATIGDNETPGSAGTVNLGSGRTAIAISVGSSHTCAILDTGDVRCWGLNSEGQLGYGNTTNIGDNETPGSVGPVDIGSGRTAVAISAGGRHTCVILDTGAVRCWGVNFSGRLGYGHVNPIGDNETPASAGPVDLGAGRSAVAITAGGLHTCAIRDTGDVLCWGYPFHAQLGYGNTSEVGDNETPGSVGPVDIGTGRTAVAITADGSHTCVVLDTGALRCWGANSSGELGYGNTTQIGDNETPGPYGPVSLGGVVNTPPTADAGADQMETGDLVSVSLTGSSVDPDGLPVSYLWQGTPDPADVAAPSVDLVPGVHTFTLTVEDAAGGMATDTVTVTVDAPPAPPPTEPPPTTPPPTTPPPPEPPVPPTQPMPPVDETPAFACAAGDGAAFGDIAGSYAAAQIGCLHDAGVVAGTTGTTYSPHAPMTREQMAVILMAAYEVATGGPAGVPSAHPFTDVAGSYAEARIGQLFGLGVTSGCAPALYCPAGTVTRGEMAVFLMRLYEAVTGQSPAPAAATFSDVSGHFAETAINQLVALGITAGSGAGTYGPDNPTTREQMAVFVAATLATATAA